jgi:hypothetical protein
MFLHLPAPPLPHPLPLTPQDFENNSIEENTIFLKKKKLKKKKV